MYYIYVYVCIYTYDFIPFGVVCPYPMVIQLYHPFPAPRRSAIPRSLGFVRAGTWRGAEARNFMVIFLVI
jgi:hypothetical protein